MDPAMYREILLYKTRGKYPEKARKGEKFIIRRRAEQYVVQDGELYYIRKKGTEPSMKVKVVKGAEEADSLFLEFHASAIGAHCGQHRTREAISSRYYWPGMSSDIDNWVTQCPKCQGKRTTIKLEEKFTPIIVKEPWELLGMDLIGKLSKTPNGNQYICVLIDYFTKWVEAFPISSKSAEDVTMCIVKSFYTFGAPKRILTDQGREFINQVNKGVCELLNIKRSLCSPYHPQTNGLVERMNGTIQRALSKLCQQKPETWDTYLDAVILGFRTKKQLTTRHSPYFIMFGREARYPSEVPESYEVNRTVEDVLGEEVVFPGIKLKDKIYETVRANAQTVVNKTKARKEAAGAVRHTFTLGEKVLRKNLRSQQRKGGKMDRDLLGPFTITAVQGKSADLTDEKGKVFPSISLDHLVPYTEEFPRVPHKVLSRVAPGRPTSQAPAVVSRGSPAPAVVSRGSPAPAVVSRGSPAPAVVSRGSPAPAVVSRGSPAPAVVSRGSPAPAVVRRGSPAPAVVSPGSPAPAVVRRGSPAPAVVSRGSPAPAVVSPVILEKYVEAAWSGKGSHVLLSKIGPYKLFYWDIGRFAPDRELESEVINAYITALVRRFNLEGDEKAFLIESFTMSKIWRGSYQTLRKLDPSKYSLILGIINEHHHWTLAVIYPSQKKTIFLDPLGESKEKVRKCLETTRAFMRTKGCHVSRWSCETVSHPIQSDGTSCGVFVCKFAEDVLKGRQSNFSPRRESIAIIRKEMAINLLKESDDLSSLCLFCGELDTLGDAVSQDEWIACDGCNRWFHHTCVGQPSTNVSFFCAACTM